MSRGGERRCRQLEIREHRLQAGPVGLELEASERTGLGEIDLEASGDRAAGIERPFELQADGRDAGPAARHLAGELVEMKAEDVDAGRGQPPCEPDLLAQEVHAALEPQGTRDLARQVAQIVQEPPLRLDDAAQLAVRPAAPADEAGDPGVEVRRQEARLENLHPVVAQAHLRAQGRSPG